MSTHIKKWIDAIRSFMRWLFNENDNQPSQSIRNMKSVGSHSPNIVNNAPATFNIITKQVIGKETNHQIWHNPPANDGGVAPIKAEAISTRTTND